jgi:predicted dehydrogenase
MKKGFGIVGIGMISEFHAKAINAMESGELVACCSRSQQKAEDFAGEYGGIPYSSLDDFLRDENLDIITVCTPSGAHLEPALGAIQAGKHVIVEKPLEITLKRCDRIIQAAEEKNVKLAGIFPARFHGAPQLIKQAVAENRFGVITLGDAYIKWYRSQEYYDEGGWKGTWKYDGGGALMNQSIHAIDLLQWFMGPVSKVQALTGTLAHERIEVEDTAAAVLHFENGAMGVIEGATSVYPGFLKRVEISGSSGSIVLEEEDLRLWQFREELEKDERIRNEYVTKTTTGGGASDPSAIGFHGHQAQFEDFCRSVEEDRIPLVDGKEARKAVEIILAIYESARTGQAVELPL